MQAKSRKAGAAAVSLFGVGSTMSGEASLGKVPGGLGLWGPGLSDCLSPAHTGMSMPGSGHHQMPHQQSKQCQLVINNNYQYQVRRQSVVPHTTHPPSLLLLPPLKPERRERREKS